MTATTTLPPVIVGAAGTAFGPLGTFTIWT